MKKKNKIPNYYNFSTKKSMRTIYKQLIDKKHPNLVRN